MTTSRVHSLLTNIEYHNSFLKNKSITEKKQLYTTWAPENKLSVLGYQIISFHSDSVKA